MKRMAEYSDPLSQKAMGAFGTAGIVILGGLGDGKTSGDRPLSELSGLTSRQSSCTAECMRARLKQPHQRESTPNSLGLNIAFQ